MRILFLGDVVGKTGRTGITDRLPKLRTDWGLDFVVVNGENASNGAGLTAEHAKGILAASPKAEAKPAEAAKPAAGANPFKTAMDADKHPNVGADGAAGEGGAGEEPAHMRILRAQEAATGLKLVKNA